MEYCEVMEVVAKSFKTGILTDSLVEDFEEDLISEQHLVELLGKHSALRMVGGKLKRKIVGMLHSFLKKRKKQKRKARGKRVMKSGEKAKRRATARKTPGGIKKHQSGLRTKSRRRG